MGLRTTALSTSDGASGRTEASKVLLALGSEELAARLSPPRTALPVEITEQPEQVVRLDVSDFPADLLQALADEGADSGIEAGVAGGTGTTESD